MEFELEKNADKTKYMLMPPDQDTDRINNINNENSCFWSEKELKYLGTALTNQNSIQKNVRADCTQGMFVIIRCRNVCLPVCYAKIKRSRCTEL